VRALSYRLVTTDDGAPVIEGCVLMKVSPPNPQEESFDVIRNFR